MHARDSLGFSGNAGYPRGYGFLTGGVAAFSAKDGATPEESATTSIAAYGPPFLLADRARDRLPRLAEALFRKVRAASAGKGSYPLKRRNG